MRLYLIRFLTKRLLKFVTAEDVLRIVGKDLYLGKSKLSDEEVGILKDEAQTLSQSLLWEYLRRNLRYLATMKMGEQAKSTEDIIFAQAMFHNLNVEELFIDRLKNL